MLQHFRDASSTLRTVDAQLHASHTLSVFTIVLKIWQHHQSRPNNSDHDWLVKPIQPTLNILELYSHFTEILLEMYQRCEEELVLVRKLIKSKDFINAIAVVNYPYAYSLIFLHSSIFIV